MHSRLEQYLQTVEQNLQHLPTDERQNELSEIRLHMESLVEAHKELCDTEEEAVTQTLAQFGRAQTLGKDLTQVHQSRGKSRFDTLPGAIAFNYIGGNVASLVASHLLVLSMTPNGFPAALWIGRGLMTTFCVDWLTGAVMPHYAVKGTLSGRLIGACLTLFILVRRQQSDISLISVGSLVIQLLFLTTIGVALSLCGAKLGVHWRKKRDKKLRLAH